MTFDFDDSEIELLRTLTPYPRFYPAEFENSLNHMASLKVATRHPNGWSKGSEHQAALNWLKGLQPSRIKTCKSCGG